MRALLIFSLLLLASGAGAEEDEEDALENPPPPRLDLDSLKSRPEADRPTRVETATRTKAADPDTEVRAQSSTAARTLSWNVLGAPRGSRVAVQVEVGYARLPRGTVQLPIADGLIVGARGGFSFADRVPGRPFSPSLEVLGLVRWVAPLLLPFELGVTGELGARLGDGQAVVLSLGAEATHQLGEILFVGGSFSVPITIATGGAALTAMSVEAGPLLEAHLAPSLALTLDARVGVGALSTVLDWSLSALAGVALRL
ncbi:MAG: hypothetical protein HYV07_26625 [Deltaproteobacteria bacterium]|nr:hypothetical protein [Deltaproteobacteria bacterium]